MASTSTHQGDVVIVTGNVPHGTTVVSLGFSKLPDPEEKMIQPSHNKMRKPPQNKGKA